MSMTEGEAIFPEHGTYLDLHPEVTEADVVLVVTDRLDPGTFGVPYVIDEVRRALGGSAW